VFNRERVRRDANGEGAVLEVVRGEGALLVWGCHLMEPKQAKIGTEGVRHYQPRALLFSVLSMLWVFPSLGACWILFSDRSWVREGVEGLKLEQWVAVGLLLAHVMFLWLRFCFRRSETPVPLPEAEPED